MRVLDPVSLVLRKKGCDIWSIPSDATVYSAMQMMADKDVGALLVMDDGQLVGLDFGERLRAKSHPSGTRFEGDSGERDHGCVADYHPPRVSRRRSHAADHNEPDSPSSSGLRRKNSWDDFNRRPCELDGFRAGP